VGLVGRQAVAQAELQLHNLQPALSYVQRERKNALTELAVCLGAGQGAVPQVPGAIEYAPLRFDLALESARAVTNRPDLRLLRAIISAMAEDRESVRAGYFPLVSLVAMSQYAPETKALTARPEIVNGQDTRYTETRYGVAYTWQVIDNGRVTGASRRMAGNVAAVRITLQRLEENVPRELATLARTLETVEARYHALEQSRTQAEELLKLVETRLALGEATQLEHLNAQSNLLNVRAGQLMGTYDNEIARAEFDRLTGRYLDFSADAPASRNNTGTQGAAQNGP
jgi:outer membrane protein TolC